MHWKIIIIIFTFTREFSLINIADVYHHNSLFLLVNVIGKQIIARVVVQSQLLFLNLYRENDCILQFD